MTCMLLISFTYYKSVKRRNLKWRGELADTYTEAHVCSLLSLLLAHFSHLLTQTLFEFLISEKKKPVNGKARTCGLLFS